MTDYCMMPWESSCTGTHDRHVSNYRLLVLLAKSCHVAASDAGACARATHAFILESSPWIKISIKTNSYFVTWEAMGSRIFVVPRL